ncbi:MAG: hypothetical protein IKF39_02390 [Oscillospiraceae bacterium]|nr:hypothetical protein [Oscillospiraceae bacterium]
MANDNLTVGSFLMISDDGTTYTILDDIVSYPDMGSAPEQIDVTNLSDSMMRSMLGLQSVDLLEFPVALRADRFGVVKTLEASKATKHLALVFGGTQNNDGTIIPTGSLGVLKWDGQISGRVTGGGVNEKRAATITASVMTPMPFFADATAAGVTIGNGYYTA